MTITPMMSKEEIFLLEKYLKIDDIVCEYGSGASTAWIANRVKLINSIEHNQHWFEKTKLSIANFLNANVYHVECLPEWDPSTEGTYEEFENYIKFPVLLSTKFTFFLVDGRARVACCKFITENFPNAIVAFHDYTNRAYDLEHNYSACLNYLDLTH